MKIDFVGMVFFVPEFEQFRAQVLGRQHIERGERLVHKEHFGLDDQGARKAHALAHAAGEFLRIGGLETVKADRVQNAHAALAAVVGRDAACLERRLDILEDRQPGKKRKTLEDDRDIDLHRADRLAMPENLSGRRRGKPGEHAQKSRFS